jgi:hypothetical protein
MRRIQPLVREEQLARNDARRRLVREIGKLNDLLGIR